MTSLMPHEGKWYHSILKRKIIQQFKSESRQERWITGRPTEHRHAKTQRICAVAATTIFMSGADVLRRFLFAHAHLQSFISRKHSSKKEMQNFLLILAASGLDIYLMQVSITLQCETYLQVNKQDRCSVIWGHLIKICIPGLTKFWILWGPIILNQQRNFKKLQYIFVQLIYAKGVCIEFHVFASLSNINNLCNTGSLVNLLFLYKESW